MRATYGPLVRRLVIPVALAAAVLVAATTAPAHRNQTATVCANASAWSERSADVGAVSSQRSLAARARVSRC
jgi:hypothetical protein